MSTFYAEYPSSGGVTSLNGLVGALTLIGAGGITITPSGFNITITGTGGTVTSVGLADTSATPIYSISGSPVTTSGTLDFSLISQTANTVFAGPSSGIGAQPTFRSLVSADIPNLSATYVTQSEVGAANGVASLDSSGKVPASELPSTVLEYQGLWDPSTNTPTLTDLTGTNGYVYQVSMAFAGPIVGLNSPTMVNFQVGNLVIYSSALGQWQQADSLTGVTSVNGAVGAVTVNAINQLTGDGTAGPASQSQSQVFTLSTVNSNVGSFGSSTAIPSFTVNAKGLITAASSSAVIAPASTLSGTVLNSTVVTSSLTAVGTIVTGTWNADTITVPYGGTGATTLMQYGVLLGNGTGAISTVSGLGTTGQILTSNGVSAAPTWQSPATSGTVTTVSVVSANGFAGTVANASSTPAITLSTTVTGILYGNGTSVAAAIAANFPTLNQNTTGTASNITATTNSTLTTLTALSLPTTQLTGTLQAAQEPAHTGDVTNTAGSLALSLVAITNSTITTLSSLSLPTTQLTGTLQAAQFPALTGDISTTAGSLTTTLATVNANVGSFGSSTSIPTFTVNAKGLITAASSNAVIAPAGTLTGTTLASNVVTSSLTAVGTLTSGTWNATNIATAYGGTGASLTPTQWGIIYADTTSSFNFTGAGSAGQVLTSNGTSAPTFQANTPTFSGLNTDGVIYAASASTVSSTTVGTSGQVLTSNGSGNAPTFQAAPGASTTTLQTAPYTVPSTNYNVIISGSSGNITLPDATVYTTGNIDLVHNGTSLSQKYTIVTVSSQTVGGIASGSYILCTAGERLTLTSNGTNWIILGHDTATGWTTDTTATMQFLTFTITSGNATIAATYVPAYVFTITAGQTASVGATATNNGNTYTFAQALTAGQTTAVLTGPANPTASGNLVFSGGTHSAGPVVFSAFTGNADTANTTYTVAKTVAAGTTLITQGLSTSSNPNSSGQLVKTTGTGDAVIVYSATSGTAVNSLTSTTTVPVLYGSPTNNTVSWMRSGRNMTLQIQFYQATAGATAGSGDLIFPMPTGAAIDTTVAILATTAQVAAATNLSETVTATQYFWCNASGVVNTGGAYYNLLYGVPYTSTSYRMYGIFDITDAHFPVTCVEIANNIQAWNWQVTFPISDWQP